MPGTFNPVYWYVEANDVWIAVISVTFWLICKGLVMDIFKRSIWRTAVTSLVCIFCITAFPAVLPTFWVPDAVEYPVELMLDVSVMPGQLVLFIANFVMELFT